MSAQAVTNYVNIVWGDFFLFHKLCQHLSDLDTDFGDYGPGNLIRLICCLTPVGYYEVVGIFGEVGILDWRDGHVVAVCVPTVDEDFEGTRGVEFVEEVCECYVDTFAFVARKGLNFDSMPPCPGQGTMLYLYY